MGTVFPPRPPSDPRGHQESGGLPFRLQTPRAQSTLPGAQALGPAFPTLPSVPIGPMPPPHSPNSVGTHTPESSPSSGPSNVQAHLPAGWLLPMSL